MGNDGVAEVRGARSLPDGSAIAPVDGWSLVVGDELDSDGFTTLRFEAVRGDDIRICHVSRFGFEMNQQRFAWLVRNDFPAGISRGGVRCNFTSVDIDRAIAAGQRGFGQCPRVSLDRIRALGPCSQGWRFARRRLAGEQAVTAAEARAAGCSFEDMAWYLSSSADADPEVDLRLRLWRADCAAHVLPVFEEHIPGDLRPRRAIEAAREFVLGRIDRDALEAAWPAAEAARDLAFRLRDFQATRSAEAALVCGQRRAAWLVSELACDASGNAGRERVWQYDRLVVWFSDPAPKPLSAAESYVPTPGVAA